MTREEAAYWIDELYGKANEQYDVLPVEMAIACDMAIEILKEPERKKGKWIDTRDQCGEFLCSNCRETNINNFYLYKCNLCT